MGNSSPMAISTSLVLLLGLCQCLPGTFAQTEAPCPPDNSLVLPSGKMYSATEDLTLYSGAYEQCRRQGGMVAIPRDEEEQRNLVFLKNCVNNGHPFWLGIKKIAGVWSDDSGTALGNFTSWAPGEPDEDKPCSYIVKGDHEVGERRDNWADTYCHSGFSYICEIEVQPDHTVPPCSAAATASQRADDGSMARVATIAGSALASIVLAHVVLAYPNMFG
ncbi:CLEC3A [Branchiostoma lanceolatum]|uniref:CLEC3A protein n=2 Tax=Branchiostoma lanceolatum TaxID=7740 RepID=A0A8J9ZNV7_BRALA|nr:CLEC3A [Branchiostoma lanceolatum]